MSWLSWLVGKDKDNIITEGISAIRKGADELHYSKEEKEANRAAQDVRDKSHEVTMEQEITKRWVSDNSAPITKLVRPVSYFFVTFCTFVFGALDATLEGFELSESYIGMYKDIYIGMTIAYFGVRGWEKVKGKAS